MLFETVTLLFLGNSHTNGNNLPGMVKALLESDGTGRKAVVEHRMAGFLEDFGTQKLGYPIIQSRKWSGIILQGLKMSSSHKYEYDHTGAVQIAKFAKQHAEQVIFFAEWRRNGWDETEWIVNQYRPLSTTCDVPIAPVGRLWDLALKDQPRLPLWLSDGNHASEQGSYLAALGLYYKLFGSEGKPTWRANSVSPQWAAKADQWARSVILKN